MTFKYSREQRIPEPTVQDCDTHAKMFETEDEIGYACWYPQMGGYVGKALVILSKLVPQNNTCFDVLVWHDGEFPFDGDNPCVLHHCDPDQFIRFGNTVAKLQGQVH